MSENSMRKFIEARLIAGMIANHPDWGVMIPNVKFKKGDQFVSYVIKEDRSFQTTLGQRAFNRHIGTLELELYVQVDSGVGNLNTVADYLGSLFSFLYATLDDNDILVFRTATHRFTGSADGYASKLVEIPWYRDELFTSEG